MGARIEVVIATEKHAEGISKVICDAIRRVNAKDYPIGEIDRLLANFSVAHVVGSLNQRLTLVALIDNEIVGTRSI